MYNTIVNPSTGREVKIHSRLGKNIIKNYVYMLNGGVLKQFTLPAKSIDSIVKPIAPVIKDVEQQVKAIVKPSAPPAKPVAPPAKLVAPPAKPDTHQVKPVAPPAKPVAPPAKPVALPAKLVAPPAKLVAPPAKPVAPPAKPVAPPAKPVAPPAKPVAPPAKPVAPPAKPVAPHAKPVAPPAKPVAPPAKPVAPPAKPVAPLAKPFTPPAKQAIKINQLTTKFKKPIHFLAVNQKWGKPDILIFTPDNRCKRMIKKTETASWNLVNDTLTINWDKWPATILTTPDNGDTYVEVTLNGLQLTFTSNPTIALNTAITSSKITQSPAHTKKTASVVYRKGDIINGFYYLFQHRSHNIHGGDILRGANQLALPGGSINPDETDIAGGWRESIEERVPFKNLSLSDFTTNIVYNIPITNTYPRRNGLIYHSQFVIDANTFIDDPAIVPKLDEVDDTKFPTGYVWISERELDGLLNKKIPSLHDLKLWDLVLNTLFHIRPALGYSGAIDLYHGTTATVTQSIILNGFKNPNPCSLAESCLGKNCKCACPMLGRGIYFAQQDKATSNAERTATFNPATNEYVGVIFWCKVDLGKCKIAIDEPCPCGCELLYVDHLAKWNTAQGYDSIYLCENTAAKRSEWCVSKPSQIKIHATRTSCSSYH